MYLRPLSFKEYRTIQPDKPFDDVWTEYMTFGGLPYCALLPSREEKADYLKHLFDEVFLRDIIERNRPRMFEVICHHGDGGTMEDGSFVYRFESGWRAAYSWLGSSRGIPLQHAVSHQ